MRTFIQETLRRSRTSYSTLQVALYYLIVIRPHIPKGDFSDLSVEKAQERRALQCGRRMFLAALILASKYLQDRNFSARAWSRISGLQTAEININEFAFLDAVNWRLHISDTNFQRWTDLVVKHTSGGATSDEARKSEWSKLILTLTPELTVEGIKVSEKADEQPDIRGRIVGGAVECPSRADLLLERTAPISDHAPVVHEAKPPASIQIPKLTVSSLLSNSPEVISLEAQPSMEAAPTARMTDTSPNKPPAARNGSGGSMASAVATAHMSQLQRCATEDMSIVSRRGVSSNLAPTPTLVRSTLTRRSSLSCSMTSSPETINDSDSSTSSSPFGFSRSSSISSASSIDSLPPPPYTRRHRMKLQGKLGICSNTSSRSSSAERSASDEPGLDTSTPSPPKYLTLRPRASRDFSSVPDSLASRKRRLATEAEALGRDTGVSPNRRSGMTPQMKVQLHMRSPLSEVMGSKRLRCGSQETSTLAFQNYRGAEEVL